MNTHTTPPLTPATPIKLPLALWVTVSFSVAFSIGGGVGSFLVAQHQIGQHERRIERLENDRELLLRIDERTQQQVATLADIKRQLERLTAK